MAKEETTVMTIKMTTDERQRMEKAAGGYPVSTWARITLLEAAEAQEQKHAIREASPTGDPQMDRYFKAHHAKVKKHRVTARYRFGRGVDYVCDECGTEWSPGLKTGGKLPRLFWRCPEGCNDDTGKGVK